MIAGRYALEAEIGRGGMGAVWRGRDEVLGRTVALKQIGVAPGGLSADALRAEREAKLAAKLNHANVVAVFDLVSEAPAAGVAGQQWLVMEYVEGTDLADMIRTRGRLSPEEAAPVLAQVASALAAAHSAGIVHRDVKPSNILVTPSGQVKLSDFGIARAATDPSLTQTGLVTGSPAYLSPEAASGQSATPASDVWSWGATLYHALEGRTPYGAEGEGDGNLLGVLYRIVHEQPPHPESAGWLAPVLAGTMTRDVSQRWSMERAQEFLAAGPGLSIFPGATTGTRPGRRTRTYDDPPASTGATQVLPAGGAPVPPPPPAPPPRAPQRRSDERRRPWLAIVIAAVVLVALMVAAFVIGLGDDDDGGTATDGSSSPGASSAPAGPSESGSPSASDLPAEPDAADMESFVQDYIATAVSDPEAAFQRLTPQFQEQSNGLDGYLGFWGGVESARILDISADPETLQVSYDYRYVTSGGPQNESVTLQLELTDGVYLISGEA